MQVSVWKADGWVGYEEIYAFGHKDATSTSEFVKMTMAPLGVDGSEKEETLSLELSAFHFAPVSGNKPYSAIPLPRESQMDASVKHCLE